MPPARQSHRSRLRARRATAGASRDRTRSCRLPIRVRIGNDLHVDAQSPPACGRVALASEAAASSRFAAASADTKFLIQIFLARRNATRGGDECFRRNFRNTDSSWSPTTLLNLQADQSLQSATKSLKPSRTKATRLGLPESSGRAGRSPDPCGEAEGGDHDAEDDDPSPTSQDSDHPLEIARGDGSYGSVGLFIKGCGPACIDADE